MAVEGERATITGRKRLDQVRRYYDGQAFIYSLDPVQKYGFRAIRTEVVDSMGLSPGDTAVDMGTGAGANLPYLREAVGPGGEVIGIDISPGMLARARKKISRYGWDNVSLVEGDIANPPVDGPVDGIMSSLVVEMFDEADRLVEEWTRYVDDGAIANLDAGYSEREYGRVINPLLDVYCWSAERGWGDPFAGDRPGKVLLDRRRKARRALEDSGAEVESDDAFAGIIHWHVGRYRE